LLYNAYPFSHPLDEFGTIMSSIIAQLAGYDQRIWESLQRVMPDLSPKIIKMAQAGSTKERRLHIDSGFLWQLDQKNSVLSEGV
jgi:hypothetical protein